MPGTYNRNDCLKKCMSFDWATACEFSDILRVKDKPYSKCTVHSTNVIGASGDKNFFCHMLRDTTIKTKNFKRGSVGSILRKVRGKESIAKLSQSNLN